MAFDRDLSVIQDIVFRRDTACAATAGSRQAAAMANLVRFAREGSKDAFLLEAMKGLALTGNGHTRIIPNPAIRVVPLRFVAIGQGIYVTEAPSGLGLPPECSVLAVNGVNVEDVFDRARPYLAGTPARQRAIFPILLAWPFALRTLGVAREGQDLSLDVKACDGSPSRVTIPVQNLTSASALYPMREHGHPDARYAPGFVTVHRPEPGVLVIELSEFHDPNGTTLDTDVAMAARRIAQQPEDNLILDLRGNRGGSFLRALPIVDALHRDWRGDTCVVLVDKFTFSAAIVCVALIFDRLKDRMRLIGEDMGDTLTFHAEGDLIRLDQSGALLRYSDAFHDWSAGTADATTPPDIRQHLVAAAGLPAVAFEDISARDRRCGPDPQMRRALSMVTTP